MIDIIPPTQPIPRHPIKPVVNKYKSRVIVRFFPAKTGRPFCGRAGKVLDELLASVGIERQDVYVTNVVKDRPPGNRDPFPDEISIYAPFLDRQIEIIKPKVVATLGRFSMQYVMNRYGLEWELAPISVLHGKVFSTNDFKFVPLYHPAAAIYNQHLLETLKEDFKVLKTLVNPDANGRGAD